MSKKMSPEEEVLFRAQMFEYIRSRGAAKIFVRYSGGHDEGGFDDGEWQDKDDNELTAFVAYIDGDEDAQPVENNDESGVPAGWSKTYNHEFEVKMRDWLDTWLYEKYGGFNNEPEVDGSLIIDATLGVITAEGTLGTMEYESFTIDF